MEPENITVHRLGPGDADALAQVNVLFSAAFEDADSYLTRPPSALYAARVLAKDHIIALVARQQGSVIGALVAYELDKLEQQRSEIYIYDLAVDAGHRRKGVATALIDHLRGVARAKGAWVIYVQADLGDDPAIALYTKLGSREDVLHFDIMP